jgi:hypothetical protein
VTAFEWLDSPGDTSRKERKMKLKKRDRKRPPEKLYWWNKSRPLTTLAAVLFLASMPCFGTEPANLNPALPELLQNLHDLYLEQYPLFAAAFSGAVKLPLKTAYGEELKTNVNLCEPYQHMIVDDSARLIRKVAPISSERGQQKETINELISLYEHLAEANQFLADVLLKLSFETGLDWRHQFYKLQSESVFYQMVLNTRIQQLITATL